MIFVYYYVSKQTPLSSFLLPTSERPRGLVLGPTFFNIYTLPFYDFCLGHELTSDFYADDSQMYIMCPINYFSTIDQCFLDVENWMACNRLKLNGDKIELTVFCSPSISRRVTSFPSRTISQALILPQSRCKNLGSYFDQKPTMDIHVKNVCQSSNFHLKISRLLGHIWISKLQRS